MFGRSGEPYLKLAASIKMLHTATLIHDDLLDRAPLRWGRETYHTIWPVNATVLAGDYLLARAVSMVASLENPRILRIISDTFCSMWSGEIRQTFGIDWRNGGMAEYLRVIEAKTASLFSASSQMSSIPSGAGEDQIEAPRIYGRELGLAFQVVDDVLDLLPYEAEPDKPVESDLRQGLITLPAILYLENGGDEALINAVVSSNADENDLQSAIKAIRSSGAIEATMDEARVHAGRAKEALDLFPGCVDRQILLSLAEYVVDRRS